MFDTLSDRLDATFKKLRARGKLHPKQVDNALADMRLALLDADVAVEVADDFLARVRVRSLSQEVMKSLTPAQHVVKIVNEELTATMGGEHRPFDLGPARPAVILVAGVQGSGKTAVCAKLAKSLKSKGRRPLCPRWPQGTWSIPGCRCPAKGVPAGGSPAWRRTWPGRRRRHGSPSGTRPT